MSNRKKCFLKYVCFPMLFLFGCSTSYHEQVQKHSVEIKSLEKRTDDLSGKINLVVNDANILHNEMEEAKTSNIISRKKIDGLEASIRDLNERITSLSTSAKTPDIVPSAEKEIPVKMEESAADSSRSSGTQETEVQHRENAESPLTVAKGFWDAMNAKDIQSVMSHTTKESGDKLRIKDNDAITDGKITFGEVMVEDTKAIIKTATQPYRGTTTSEAQMQTILVKEDGQWKVDVDQTMASVPGGAMGASVQDVGQTAEEGLKKGTGEMKK